METPIKTDRALLGAARFVSMAFTPFTIPTLAFLSLFLFSYLRIMPMEYKLIVVAIVFCFTIAMPMLTIYLFHRMVGLASAEPSDRKRHFMPYLFTIISYAFCLLMMHRLNIPWYMSGIILASLLAMIVFLLINLKWKLSEHMGGVGGVIGGFVSFSALFGYNPVSWLCVFILVAGALGSARIILGHHKLGEVLFGFAVGLICSLLVLHPMNNFFFRFILM
jgi:hypothetical protein